MPARDHCDQCWDAASSAPTQNHGLCEGIGSTKQEENRRVSKPPGSVSGGQAANNEKSLAPPQKICKLANEGKTYTPLWTRSCHQTR